MESKRQTSIGKQIQKDLSEILRNFSTLAPGKMLTVTKVNITSDLGLANINVSVFPSSNSELTIAALNDHRPAIRKELGNKLRHQLRKIPEIKFYIDDSLDYIDNIDNLLKS
jgi:ribosome-binding factor A